MYVCMYVCMCICVYMCLYVRICVYMCVCILHNICTYLQTYNSRHSRYLSIYIFGLPSQIRFHPPGGWAPWFGQVVLTGNGSCWCEASNCPSLPNWQPALQPQSPKTPWREGPGEFLPRLSSAKMMKKWTMNDSLTRSCKTESVTQTQVSKEVLMPFWDAASSEADSFWHCPHGSGYLSLDQSRAHSPHATPVEPLQPATQK